MVRFGDEFREKAGLFSRGYEGFVGTIVEKDTDFLDFSRSLVNIYRISYHLDSPFGIAGGFTPLAVGGIGVGMEGLAAGKRRLAARYWGLADGYKGLVE